MDSRQRTILAKAIELDSPLCASVVEWAEFIAEETLSDKIYLNGYLIYESVKD